MMLAESMVKLVITIKMGILSVQGFLMKRIAKHGDGFVFNQVELAFGKEVPEMVE